MGIKQRWEKTNPIQYSTKEVLALVLPLLNADERILIAYLFGSRANNTKESSDIDIAIYTSRDFLWDDYYLLYGEITKKLHSDRLDLLWLNIAEPILCFEVIRNGKVLFYKDADILNDFELKAKKRYYDYSFYLNKRRARRQLGL